MIDIIVSIVGGVAGLVIGLWAYNLKQTVCRVEMKLDRLIGEIYD